MVSHRRLLWLIVMLAGLAAAVLYLSGTAAAETGSPGADGTGGETSNSATTSTSASSVSTTDESSTEESRDGSAAAETSPAIRPSSLISAVTRARDARSSVAQRESGRRTPDPTTASQTVRSPAVRAFRVEAATSPVEKTKPVETPPEEKTKPESTVLTESTPAIESLSIAAPEKPTPQPTLATVVLDVMSGLGTSAPPDPPAASASPGQATATAELEGAVVTRVVVTEQRVAQTIIEGPPAGAVVANSSPPEATNPLTAAMPSVTETVVDGVVMGQSTLTIPCGPGYEVPADWYFPTGPDPPKGVIWLQHGFLAQGPWYSTTAATLAKQTNSIVVAPSITSNFLQCDGCWLNGDPMERAVASMFVDRTALTASASAAAGVQVTFPDKFVLVGHSAGGGFVVAVARYLVGTRAFKNLAGVVMFDGVALNDTMTASLDKIPKTVPVYQIAAPSYIFNNFGSGTAQLVQARPGDFTGFQLAGGSHVDSMRGNPIIQFAAQLLTGFSRPANVQAVQTLAAGWINDMYTSCQRGRSCQGIYADPGQTIKIGEATATSLPTPPTWFTPIETLIRNIALIFERFIFGLFNPSPAAAATDRIAA